MFRDTVVKQNRLDEIRGKKKYGLDESSGQLNVCTDIFNVNIVEIQAQDGSVVSAIPIVNPQSYQTIAILIFEASIKPQFDTVQ